MDPLKAALLTYADLVEQSFTKDPSFISSEFYDDYVEACKTLCEMEPGKDHLKAVPAILEYIEEQRQERLQDKEPDMNGANQAERDERHYNEQYLGI